VAKPGVPEIMLLHLVYTGVDTVEKLSKKLDRPQNEVKEIADKLEITGYLQETSSGIIWKRKKFKLTEQGLRELLSFKKKLKEDVRSAAEKLAEGRLSEAKEAVSHYAPYLKDLAAVGILDEDDAKLIPEDLVE